MLGGALSRRQTHRAIASAPWDDRWVGTRRKRRSKADDPLAAYRRIRKPMPPPEKVIADKRRKLEAEQAEREAQQGVEDR